MSSISQRILARRLNIALGTTNALIQTLVANHWIKLSQTGGRTRYSLTESGLTEKNRLQRRRLGQTIQDYAALREHIAAKLDRLQAGARRVVLYGLSDLTEIAYAALVSRDLELVAVVSDTKAGERFFDYEVLDGSSLSTEDLNGLPFDAVLISCARHTQAITQKLLARGFAPSEIVPLPP